MPNFDIACDIDAFINEVKCPFFIK